MSEKKYSKNGFGKDLFDRKYQEGFHNQIHNEEHRTAQLLDCAVQIHHYLSRYCNHSHW